MSYIAERCSILDAADIIGMDKEFVQRPEVARCWNVLCSEHAVGNTHSGSLTFPAWAAVAILDRIRRTYEAKHALPPTRTGEEFCLGYTPQHFIMFTGDASTFLVREVVSKRDRIRDICEGASCKYISVPSERYSVSDFSVFVLTENCAPIHPLGKTVQVKPLSWGIVENQTKQTIYVELCGPDGGSMILAPGEYFQLVGSVDSVFVKATPFGPAPSEGALRVKGNQTIDVASSGAQLIVHHFVGSQLVRESCFDDKIGRVMLGPEYGRFGNDVPMKLSVAAGSYNVYILTKDKGNVGPHKHGCRAYNRNSFGEVGVILNQTGETIRVSGNDVRGVLSLDNNEAFALFETDSNLQIFCPVSDVKTTDAVAAPHPYVSSVTYTYTLESWRRAERVDEHLEGAFASEAGYALPRENLSCVDYIAFANMGVPVGRLVSAEEIERLPRSTRFVLVNYSSRVVQTAITHADGSVRSISLIPGRSENIGRGAVSIKFC